MTDTTYAYDESAVQPRGDMTGYAAPGHNYRGNATKVLRWLNPGNQWLETRRTYDEAGNVRTETDPRNNTMTIGYADAYDGTQPPGPTFAFPTTVTNALSHVVSRRYDYATGQVTKFTDANGVETTFSYDDPLDRLRTVVRVSNHADARVRTTHTYDDALPGVTTASDQYVEYDQRLASTVVFDGLGRQIKTRTQTGSGTIEVWREYDGVDRVRRVSQPGLGGPGAYTATGYDTLDRVVTVTHPDGSVARTGYRGNVAMATDENGRRRKSTVDALGRLTGVVEHPSCEAWESGCSVTAALNYSTSYTYDALDNLTGVTQGAQSRTFGYDSLGRLICSANPETRVGSASCASLPADGVERYTYDGNGNLLTKTDTRNITVSHTYDAGNRLEHTSYSSGAPAVRRCYDGRTYAGGVCTGNEVAGQKGRLAAVGNEVSATQFTYHPVGWVTASTQTVAGVAAYQFEYEYYRDGRLARQRYPSSRSVVTCYDRAGRVAWVSPEQAGTADLTVCRNGGTPAAASSYAVVAGYHPHGAIQKLQLGNGLWEWADYHSNRLQPVEFRLGTTDGGWQKWRLKNFYAPSEGCYSPQVSQCNNGNVWGQEQTVAGTLNLNQTYDYDWLNRLKAASESGAWAQSYSYDRYGNRTASGDLPFASLAPAVFDQATNRISQAGYGYDAAGNLTSYAQRSLTYDAENRQKTLTENGVTFEYFYDGEGRRVKKVAGTTTVYVYDAFGQLAAEYSSDGGSQAGRRYVTVDHLGSSRVVTDAGQQAKHYDYYPFGEGMVWLAAQSDGAYDGWGTEV